MTEWILRPEDQETLANLRKSAPVEAGRFLRGGYFPEIFRKYPEGNHLHKRMLWVSREAGLTANEEARRELYKAQCNDAYWHGIFGGLYLPHLREAVFHHLLEAEKAMDIARGWSTFDYDSDGRDELFFRGKIFNVLIKPSSGGGIVELDYRPVSRNMSDVLARRKESYHDFSKDEAGDGKSIHELGHQIPAEAEGLLRYDRHPRHSLLDHFLHPLTSREDFEKIRYEEKGDFVSHAYFHEREGDSLSLWRQGRVGLDEGGSPVLVKKTIVPGEKEISVRYHLEGLSGRTQDVLFGCEWNLSLFDGEFRLAAKRAFFLQDRISFSPSSPDDIWHFPLETLSRSEKGYDIIRQGLCVVPIWRVTLSPGKPMALEIVLENHA
jgi:alpha-amylase